MKQKICKIDGCERSHFGKGFCEMHYDRQRNGISDMRAEPLQTQGCKWKPDDLRYKNKYRLCDVPDCGKPFFAKGLCKNHYMSFKRKGHLSSSVHFNFKPECEANGCNKISKTMGYCKFHYNRKLNGIELDRPKGVKGKLNVNWNGGASEYHNHYEMKKVRIDVLNRDKNTCYFCGKEAKQIHHLDLSKDNHSMDNLVTCCQSCNMKHAKPRKIYDSKYRNRYGLTLNEISVLLKIKTEKVKLLHEYNTLDNLLTRHELSTIRPESQQSK